MVFIRTAGLSLEQFHLFRYVDEQVFRYNNHLAMCRLVGNPFMIVMRQIASRRIKYEELTSRGTDSVHQA